MSRYRGYTDPMEVMIAVLDELREIKELMKAKDQTPKTTASEPLNTPKKRGPRGKNHVDHA